MKKIEFIKAMEEYATKYGKVEVTTVEKGGYSYTGLVIRKPDIPMPVVNLDTMYKDFTDNKIDLKGCCDMVDKILNMKPQEEFDISMIKEWEKAKSHLFIRVVGKDCGGIYRKIEDLYLVPYIQVTPDECAITKVTPQILDIWNVSEEEVFAQAEKNQITLRPAKITPICEALGLPDMGLNVYIISTEKGVNGASAIFYEGMVEQIKKRIGGDFYIIPSSIHELLVVPKDDMRSIDDLKEMVTTVNATEVGAEDILNNSVYTYDFEEGEFRKVG